MTIIGHKGTALVTGASTGIGAVYADRLAKRGYDLILVARNQAKLQELAERLEDETGRAVETLVADLNDPADLTRVAERLKTDAAITMLVNNAGVGAMTPLLDSDIDKMDEMISLNIGALTRLTYAAVPGFVARGAGTLINISSIVGISPETMNGVYGGTKAYVLALTQSLQHELGDKGLRFQAVLPGATATPFWDIAGVGLHNLPAEIVMTTEHLVDASLAGLDLGEIVTIPALPDGAEWDRYEAARRAMSSRLSSTAVAERYRVAVDA
ncbi:MAG: SDR family NAD(P)-dependent oxidoreductase [Janthinobacterium lividum]